MVFPPDGRQAVAETLYWAPDIVGTWIEAPGGSVLTVRMNAGQHDDGTARQALMDPV
ncbi:MAG: hypothetical protein AAF366_03385 [Pseudomonadota bacterium]